MQNQEALCHNVWRYKLTIGLLLNVVGVKLQDKNLAQLLITISLFISTVVMNMDHFLLSLCYLSALSGFCRAAVNDFLIAFGWMVDHPRNIHRGRSFLRGDVNMDLFLILRYLWRRFLCRRLLQRRWNFFRRHRLRGFGGRHGMTDCLFMLTFCCC